MFIVAPQLLANQTSRVDDETYRFVFRHIGLLVTVIPALFNATF